MATVTGAVSPILVQANTVPATVAARGVTVDARSGHDEEWIFLFDEGKKGERCNFKDLMVWCATLMVVFDRLTRRGSWMERWLVDDDAICRW
ncbi:hypothetical protein TWF730_002605 [Orbilia blumenaviensis]|uniref:Uncharacterized protein n=1 Tax=Orbilia blumenaviensis TaxID=1796055 RepID=A0AAV9UES8_9PEZI